MTHLDTSLDRWRPEALAALRIMVALLFLSHGLSKLFGYPPTPMPMPEIWSLGWIAGVLELVGGLFFLVGLGTRFVAFILSGLMAAAYFIAHAPQGFHPIVNEGELAVVYCFVFFFFIFSGAGAWALDNIRSQHVDRRETEGRLVYRH